MTDRATGRAAFWARALGMSGFLLASTAGAVEPTKQATAVFDRYAASVEARLVQEHEARTKFLVLPEKGTDGDKRLRQGGLLVERLVPAGQPDPPGALLHDWRGTAFIPGAKAAEFERLLRNFSQYSRTFAPQVLSARVTGGQGDSIQARMRVQQRHVLTVTLDTDYNVDFGRLDELHRFSISRSSEIAEIEHAGTSNERALSPAEEHGFLWRLNTYWSWEEQDGGLYVQIESISLTRSIPTGLGWAIRPFVESVPRESLAFTLHATCAALKPSGETKRDR